MMHVRSILMPYIFSCLKHSGFKARFVAAEVIFVILLVCAVPIGAHGTVVALAVANLVGVAWFWYNLVRSVDVTSDGTLRFWIGNIEIDVPFDKVVSVRKLGAVLPCSFFASFGLRPRRRQRFGCRHHWPQCCV